MSGPSHGGKVFYAEPEQLGDPVGYFAFFADPDGNTTELSWGSGWTGSHPAGNPANNFPPPRRGGLHFKGYLGNTEHGDGQQEKR